MFVPESIRVNLLGSIWCTPLFLRDHKLSYPSQRYETSAVMPDIQEVTIVTVISVSTWSIVTLFTRLSQSG